MRAIILWVFVEMGFMSICPPGMNISLLPFYEKNPGFMKYTITMTILKKIKIAKLAIRKNEKPLRIFILATLASLFILTANGRK